MTPETAIFLKAANQSLSDARTVLSVNVANQAARLAYHAQFHAAQALIFERMNKVLKTHKGVASEFHRLAQAESELPAGLAGQLSKAFRYKNATAELFVAAVRRVLLV
jgi:uncharacterized protein (UPF0332 family)